MFNDNANNNEYNPLADLDTYNPTFGQTQDQPLVDQNYNPISAALAQLPTAASTVFSTFSNIIKGSIPTPVQEQASEIYQAPVVDPGYCAPTYGYNQEVSFYITNNKILF